MAEATTTTTADTAATTATTGPTQTAGTGTMADATTGTATGTTATAGATSTTEDWRAEFAVGADGKPDDKAMERLKRFNSKGDMWKSYRELEAKVTSGQLAKPAPFPDKGTDQEKAAWRKERGLPEDIKGYKLPETITVGDADRPTVESFLAKAHARNLDNDTVADLTQWYFESKAKNSEAQTLKDREAWTETERELKQKWGSEDYTVNKALYQNFLASAPEGVREAINAARDANGRKLGGNPEFLEWAVGMARTVNPLHTVVPAGGTGGMDSVTGEIEKLEAQISADRNAWNKNEAGQKRLMQLYEARDRFNAAHKAA